MKIPTIWCLKVFRCWIFFTFLLWFYFYVSTLVGERKKKQNTSTWTRLGVQSPWEASAKSHFRHYPWVKCHLTLAQVCAENRDFFSVCLLSRDTQKCTLELVQRSENFSSCSFPSMSLATERGSLRKLWLAAVFGDIDGLDGGMSLDEGSTSVDGNFSWCIMEKIIAVKQWRKIRPQGQ